MKTIAYQEVLYRAAEAAGRTRDAVPVIEEALLKSVFALELPKVWFGEAWNDLTPPLLAVQLDTNNSFANPYTDPTSNTTTAIGDVLQIFSQDPRSSTPWVKLGWFRTQDSFTVTPPADHAIPAYPVPVPSTVFVCYLEDCPDLLALSDTALQALTLPLFLGNYLALRGAGHLLAADGAQALAGVQFGLAESALAFERTRIKLPVWASPNT